MNMKGLITIIFAITFYQISFAQKTDTALFNGVTKIIVRNNLTASENYKLAGNLMLAQGYNIGAKDAEFNQIATEPVKVQAPGISHSLAIYVVAKDNELLITGKSKNLATTKVVSWQNKEAAVEIVPFKKTRLLSQAIYNKLSYFAKGLKGKLIYSE
jgi:hypothetical protein